MKKIYLILFLFFSLAQHSWALVEDSVLAEQYKVYFRLARTDVDSTYLSNAQTLQQLRASLKESSHALDSITIVSYSSPEGPYWLNKRYAEQRGYAVYNYLQKHIEQQLSDSLVHLRFTAENWDGLRELVRNNYHRADRAELLRLLQTRRIDDTHRKIEIQKLDNGNTWEYLLQHYMPQLRHATWIIVYCTTKSDKAESLLRIEPSATQQDTIAVSVETEKEVEQPVEEQPIVQQPVVEETSITLPEAKETKWAVKTNLLYDAATLLNLSAEIPFTLNGQPYSIVAQYQFPWWDFKENRRIVRFISTGFEGRWWFKPSHYEATPKRLQRDALTGHFVGLYALTGKWDFQWDRKICYQGDFWSTGLVYGYSMPIAKRLNLEFTIAVGYASIPYQHYIPSTDWQTLYKDLDKQGTWHYFGPTRAEVSLVLPIWGNKRKGGSR